MLWENPEVFIHLFPIYCLGDFMVSKIIILGAIVAIVVGAIGYVYFGVVSPAAEKPVIEKPALLEGQNVDTEHIRWQAKLRRAHGRAKHKIQDSRTLR